MNAICLIDTTIFVEFLNIPNKSSQPDEIKRLLKQKIIDGESLFLPMATILETGNHIAQIKDKDPNRRRDCAQRFVELVQKALDGESPFQPISFLSQDEMRQWLNEFPNSASQGSGLGDLSIVHDFKRLCAQNQGRKVYIWSLDTHLRYHEREPLI